MEIEQTKAIIEAILFAAGRPVTENELMLNLELSKDDIKQIIESMKEDYNSPNKGIELITIDNSYQLCTKTKLHEYIYPIIDKRTKPNLSNAALETLSIIAYNPRITRAEIENIRGVNVDGCIYKLLEYGLIEEKNDSDDKRSKRLNLTEKGEDYFHRSVDKVNMTSRILAGKLENNEKVELFFFFWKLNDFHSHVYSEYKRFNIDEILEISAS